MPVHPHARGERWAIQFTNASGAGSSPRTWGTRPAGRRRPSLWRFIPTHVGNATGRCGHRRAAPVHPHARGERNLRRSHSTLGAGSSPRTWGTRTGQPPCRHGRPVHPHARGERRSRPCRYAAESRFIPTHVGNAFRYPKISPPAAVHPHARGERVSVLRRKRPNCGSSPRTWGRYGATGAHEQRSGSSPRTWGTRGRSRAIRCCCPVHPHARGERRLGVLWPNADLGSSPRTWGTRDRGLFLQAVGRFIPTHVGNAPRACCLRAASPVHPHARGERGLVANVLTKVLGSSPRTWGTQLHALGVVVDVRFIPTHVGNAMPVPAPVSSLTVHPHARGERLRTATARNSLSGSSPRTWGTPGRTHRVQGRCRFIPTHVGNAAARRLPATPSAVHPHARGERPMLSDPRSRSNGSSPRTWGTRGAGSARGRC